MFFSNDIALESASRAFKRVFTTYLQHLASIQPRTSFVKFARSPRTDPPGGDLTCLILEIEISDSRGVANCFSSFENLTIFTVQLFIPGSKYPCQRASSSFLPHRWLKHVPRLLRSSCRSVPHSLFSNSATPPPFNTY